MNQNEIREQKSTRIEKLSLYKEFVPLSLKLACTLQPTSCSIYRSQIFLDILMLNFSCCHAKQALFLLDHVFCGNSTTSTAVLVPILL